MSEYNTNLTNEINLHETRSSENKSPEDIAHELFSKTQNNLTPHALSMDGDNASYIYEVLVTILLEGMDIFMNGIVNMDANNLEPDYITALNPWFHSIGFNLKVDVVDRTDKELYEDYYCRIILRNYGYGPIFDDKQLTKDYHFLGNYKYKTGCMIDNIKDIYSIFVKKDKVFKISFDYYTPC